MAAEGGSCGGVFSHLDKACGLTGSFRERHFSSEEVKGMKVASSDDGKWVVSVFHEFPTSPASPCIAPLWGSSSAFTAEIAAGEGGLGCAWGAGWQHRGCCFPSQKISHPAVWEFSSSRALAPVSVSSQQYLVGLEPGTLCEAGWIVLRLVLPRCHSTVTRCSAKQRSKDRICTGKKRHLHFLLGGVT